MKRKIAESINVRINIGNFQHIELVKYAEEEIEFSNAEERVEAEKALTNDLLESLHNSIQAVTESTGKGKKEVVKVEEAIQKSVPEWLNNQNTPNIAKGANPALDKKEKIALTQKDEVDRLNKVDEDLKEFEEVAVSTEPAGNADDFFDDDDDIFN